MHRRSRIKPRQIIFIGGEGPSERAFGRFLDRCCDEADLNLHLDVKPGTGGDLLAVVEDAERRLERHPARKEIKASIVLLDRDRLDQDIRADRDPRALARRLGIEIVFQEPDPEGLLLRLHPEQEHRRVPSANTMKELRKVWPEYRKPPTAHQLTERFSVSDLRRAAEHDCELRKLLEILGLATP